MPLRLVVMRHARSPQGPDDHERPLDAVGRQQASAVAAQLLSRGWAPDRVLSSDAARARETWERMEGAFTPAPAVTFTRALYTHGADAALQLAAATPDTAGALLLLGHNPEWERLVAWLSGEELRLGTATAALLTSEASSWGQAVAAPGRFALTGALQPG